MEKKIIFKIDKRGNSKVVDMIGFGTECLSAFEATKSKLGSSVGSAELTEEFNRIVETDINIQD